MVLRIAPCIPLLPQFPHFDGEANTYFPTPIPSCTCKPSKLKQRSVLGSVALRWEMNWQAGKRTAQCLHFGKFIHNRFPSIKSPWAGLSVHFLFVISCNRAAQCCSEGLVGKQPHEVFSHRDFLGAPPQVILSKGDGDPSGGWPDITIRGRNSLSSSFHIY